MVDLYNPNAGLHGRQGGPFLDEVQNRQEEEAAALREGREPDFDNAPWRGAVAPVEDLVKKAGVDWKGETPTAPVVGTLDYSEGEPEPNPEDEGEDDTF